MPLSQTHTSLFRLGGGLNLVDPQIGLKPGVALTLDNVDVQIGGGYRRADGYERFDGHVATPSAARYYRLSFFSGGNTPIVEDDVIELTATIGGATVATLKVMYEPDFDGAWADGDAEGGINAYLQSGTLTTGASSLYIKIGAVTDNGQLTAIDLDSTSDTNYKPSKKNVMDEVRALIGAVPGSGSILGVVRIDDTVYAIRNNAGGTAAVIHKATTSGWQAITLYYTVDFTVGSLNVDEGDTLTQGGVTATIKRVMKKTGEFSLTTAAGTLVITAPAGGNFAAGAATTTGGGTLTLSGAEAAITLAPDGDYEFIIYNFSGDPAKRRIYGVDGVNYAFELSATGDIYAPIYVAGMPAGLDKPNHIAAHKNYLFLSFGASVQHSSPLSPYTWSVVLGSSELAMGDTVTQLYSIRGDVLAICAKNSMAMLYGSGTSSWSVKKFSDGLGVSSKTMSETQGRVVYFDEHRGVFALDVSDTFGDFDANALSRNIEPFINIEDRSPVFAITSKDTSQYRVYFDDKRAIIGTIFGGQVVGWSTHTLYDQFTCGWVSENSDGTEAEYVGSDNGYVYQLERGPSHDGQKIQSVMGLVFSYFGSPSIKKRFRKMTFEMQASQSITLDVACELDYGGGTSESLTTTTKPTGGLWGSAQWNQFYWGSPVAATPFVNIGGVGLNMRPVIAHNDEVDESFTVEAVNIHYSNWGLNRG